MNRVSELEAALRDSILISLSFEYEYCSDRLNQNNSVNMKFLRFGKELIEFKLFGAKEIDIYDDFSGLCVSHIKAFVINEGITLSLDPYDESVDGVEDKDNFVFTAKEYQLNFTKV